MELFKTVPAYSMAIYIFLQILSLTYSDDQKLWNMKTTIKPKSAFDVVTKRIPYLMSYQITYYMKWGCLPSTIIVPHFHWNI